jgi:hypothetical protein
MFRRSSTTRGLPNVFEFVVWRLRIVAAPTLGLDSAYALGAALYTCEVIEQHTALKK